MASRCGPPKTVSVQGYWRVTKRRRTHPTRKTPEHYWTVTNGLGQACGHHHRTLTGAVACRRRHERAQRAAKARYGRSSSPGLWRSEKR